MRTQALTVVLATGLVCLSSGAGKLMAEELAEEPLAKLKEHITLGGTIEVEAGWSEDFEDSSESDITLATAEIGVEAKITEWAIGTLNLEWVDEDDKISVDEAYITLGGTEKIPATLKAGRYFLPFGVFETKAVSDPLTLEAFETKEDAVMAGFAVAGVHGGIYVFNGDTNEGGGDDKIEHYGAHLGYTLENDELIINAHLGYLSSVVDSDGLSENLDLEADYVGGLAAQASGTFAGVTLTGEYISAIDDYQPANSTDSKPSAYHLEAGYSLELGLPLFVALSFSGTEDLAGILPESRATVVAGVDLVEGLGLKIEYSHDTDYDAAEGGTGEESDAVVVQLAYEF